MAHQAVDVVAASPSSSQGKKYLHPHGRKLVSAALILFLGFWILTLDVFDFRISRKNRTSFRFGEKLMKSPHGNDTKFATRSSGPDNGNDCLIHQNETFTILLDPLQQHNQSLLSMLNDVPKKNGTWDGEFFAGTCPPTCAVRLIPGCPYWHVESLDCHGNVKTMGGDEYYITYSDQALVVAADKVAANAGSDDPDAAFWTQPASAVAWVTDQKNGRYQLDFQASPMSPQVYSGKGVFTIYFQFTCGIGRMAYPLKVKWPHGGQSIGWARSEVVSTLPSIRRFEPPADRPNLFGFSNLLFVGDSLMQFFLGALGLFTPNINQPLNSTTLHNWNDAVDNAIRQKNVSYADDPSDFVLLTGSCAWDIFEEQNTSTTTEDNRTLQWEDHRQAVSDFLGHMRLNYPEVTVFWKSCAGFHAHVPYLKCTIDHGKNAFMDWRLKHMSTSRAEAIHQAQMEVVEQAKQLNPGKVHFLDVYPGYYLSGDLTRSGDGRHYKDILDKRIANWFVNESTAECAWRQRTPPRPEEQSRSDEDSYLVVNYNSSWVEWVNAAVFARASLRTIVWDRNDDDQLALLNGSRFDDDDDTTTLHDKTFYFRKVRFVKGHRDSQSFINGIFVDKADDKQFAYGMIFHNVLMDLTRNGNIPRSNVVVPRKGRVVLIPPLSNTPIEASQWDLSLDSALSVTAAGIPPTAAETCTIFVPSLEVSQSVAVWLEMRKHDCGIIIQSFEDPAATLAIAEQLVDAHDRSSLILSCNEATSKIFFELLSFLRKFELRKLGQLPFNEGFEHHCLESNSTL